jgi:hypothetical protein
MIHLFGVAATPRDLQCRIHKRRCKLLFAMLNWRPCLWLDMRGKVDLRKVLSRVEDQRQHNRLDIDSSSGEMLQIFWGIVLSLGWISDGFDLIDNQKVKMRKKRYPKTLLSIINHKSTESTPISTRYTFFCLINELPITKKRVQHTWSKCDSNRWSTILAWIRQHKTFMTFRYVLSLCPI